MASDTGAALVSVDPEGADLIATDLSRRVGGSPDAAPSRAGRDGQGKTGPAFLILIDQEVAQRPSVTALLDAASKGQSRAQVVLLAEDRHRLPSGPAAVIEVGKSGAPGARSPMPTR